ncbi:hypothetical protein [Methanosarcina sp.]|uniref:hypothetical protein n=1 Tax=Methanosarcina sp. TaxID=2213 RepID=UPI003C71E4D9
MDYVITYKCLAHGTAVLNNLKNHERLKKIISDLDSLIKTVDELYLREIRAAFESLSDAYITKNMETKGIRLHFAEKNLLKNSNLDKNLIIGGYPSTHLMALAHYGLSIICHLRNDDNIALKHILQTYRYSPKLARTELFPEFYDATGLHNEVMYKVSLWHTAELDRLNNESFKGEELIRKGGAFGLAAAAIAITSLFGAPHLGAAVASKKCMDIYKDSDPSTLREKAIRDLEGRIEEKEDELCSAVANELLTELGLD